MKLQLLCLSAVLATPLAHAQFDFGKLKDALSKIAPPASAASASPAPATSPTAASPTGTDTSPAALAKADAVAPTLGTGPVKGTLGGQGAVMTTCEKMAKQGTWDTVCTRPTKTFAYKGSVTNVGATFVFDPPMTSRTTQFKVVLYKNGVMDQYQEITFNTGGKTSQIAMTVTPGTYQMKLVDQFDIDKVALVDTIVVSPDTVGDRAVDNVKKGIGKLMVCSEVDDNWKCLNESTTWAANRPFNLYVRLPQAIPGLTAGWAIFKQKPDGSDGDMVEDMAQGTGGRAAYWATTQGLRLPAGTYTVYSISWSERTSSGNFKNYFAKTTLAVR